MSFSFTHLSCTGEASTSFSKPTDIDRKWDYLLVDLVEVVATDAIARGKQLQSKVSDIKNGFQTEIVGN